MVPGTRLGKEALPELGESDNLRPSTSPLEEGSPMPFTCDADAVELRDRDDRVELRFTRCGDLISTVFLSREAAERFDFKQWTARAPATSAELPG
jgi:hypothetical protein